MRVAHVSVQEHAHRQAQVGHQAGVQFVDLFHASFRELPAFLDLLVLNVDEHAFDDVANLLHVDGEADDVRPPAAFAFVQGLARNLGHVVLDGGVQLIHLIIEFAQVFGQLLVIGADDLVQPQQHGLHHIGLVQRFARSAGNGQRGRGQRRWIQMPGAAACCGLRVCHREQALHGTRHRACEPDAHQPHHRVECQVEQHHQRSVVGNIGAHMLEPQPDQRGHDDDAHDLEEQIAQRHLPRLHIGAHGRGHCQQAAAQVGAHHQPQCHIHRNTARACQRGREQHGGQAGIGQHGQHSAREDLQQ